MTTKVSHPEMAARHTAAAAVLADFISTLAAAPLSKPPDYVTWALRLADSLGSVLDAGPGDDLDDGTEPYCTACGSWVGMFHGLDGWQHFRGDPAPGGQRELYEADHPAAVGWTRPVLVTGPDASTIRAGLDEAADELRDRAANCAECEASPAELCTTCESRLERAGGYGAVAARLTEVAQ